jgi:hypothetical protein
MGKSPSKKTQQLKKEVESLKVIETTLLRENYSQHNEIVVITAERDELRGENARLRAQIAALEQIQASPAEVCDDEIFADFFSSP